MTKGNACNTRQNIKEISSDEFIGILDGSKERNSELMDIWKNFICYSSMSLLCI